MPLISDASRLCAALGSLIPTRATSQRTPLCTEWDELLQNIYASCLTIALHMRRSLQHAHLLRLIAPESYVHTIRSWAPKVLMCQATGGLEGLLISYWDESKLSFDSFISLYDKGTSWDFLILFTFFSLVPKSGKRISMLSICRNKGLAWGRSICHGPIAAPIVA